MDASERRARASAEAAEWWVRLQTEQVAEAHREEFVDWLRESAVHVAEMLRVAQVHGALEQFQRWARISTDGSNEDANVIALLGIPAATNPQSISSPPPVPLMRIGAEKAESDSSVLPVRGKGSGLRLLAIAASLCVIAIATAWFVVGNRGQIIQTERGERREVSLVDGSIIQVDPETRLRVKFEHHIRNVYLERGRALFRVAKDPTRPFLVRADDTIVRAVGTAFGVDLQKQDVVVTVAEGRVAVFPMHRSSPMGDAGAVPVPPAATEAAARSALPRISENSSVPPAPELFLTAGQQVTVQSSGSAEPVRKVDSGRELAWAEGRLVFDNDTVAAVIEQFNRYNRVQLHVSDETLARRHVSAVFNASEPESFIAFIQGATAVRVMRGDGQDITLAPTGHSRGVETEK
jgi:transmembrane sensor